MNIKELLLRWLMPQPIPRRPRISQALREARADLQFARNQTREAENALAMALQREKETLHPVVSKLQHEIVGLRAALVAEANNATASQRRVEALQQEIARLRAQSNG